MEDMNLTKRVQWTSKNYLNVLETILEVRCLWNPVYWFTEEKMNLIMLHRYLTIEIIDRRRGCLNLADEGLRRSSTWKLKLDFSTLK